MAAGDSTSSFENTPSAGASGRSSGRAPAELDERLQEEIGRAERHGTQLACLLVVVDNLDEMAGEGHRSEGVVGELREQTMAYIAGALRRELRRFDRVGLPSERELLIVLPGADGPARRDGRAPRARPPARDQGRSARPARAAADLRRARGLARERHAGDDARARASGGRAVR